MKKLILITLLLICFVPSALAKNKISDLHFEIHDTLEEYCPDKAIACIYYDTATIYLSRQQTEVFAPTVIAHEIAH
jgi:hypothetical protein